MSIYYYNYFDNDCLQLGYVFWVEYVLNFYYYQFVMMIELYLFGFYNKMKEKEIKENQ